MEISSITIISIILGTFFGTVSNSIFNNSRAVSYRHTFRKLLAVDWCLYSCKKGENIGCTYKGDCRQKHPCKLVTIDKAKAVEEHNRLRNLFASGKDPTAEGIKAADMNKLEWDDDLEFLAGCNLVKCSQIAHDPCRLTPKFSKYAGQNLWQRIVSDLKFDCAKEALEGNVSAAQAWYDEIKLTDKAKIESNGIKYETFHGIGHFTQLVWSTVTHVGCVVTTKTVGELVTCAMACNYGPGGNIKPHPMFKQGTPCSECPEGLTCDAKWPALCGTGKPTVTVNRTSTILRSNIVYVLLPCIVFSYQCYFVK